MRVQLSLCPLERCESQLYLVVKHRKTSENIYREMIVVENKKELKELIKQRIHEQGLSCDLNDIDVSRVEDMSDLFIDSAFNGDISEWDVSNVKNMSRMFARSGFSGNISEWNVSRVEDMYGMFYDSRFSGDLNGWDVSSVRSMCCMFWSSPTEGIEPKWYKTRLISLI